MWYSHGLSDVVDGGEESRLYFMEVYGLVEYLDNTT